MHADPSIPLTTVFAFLLVLARVSGVFIFVPMPGFAGGPEPVKILFSLALTVALYPVWPVLHATPRIGLLVGWLVIEAAMGLTIGLLVGFLGEAFGLFGQMIALHSGHSFASTIDPTTQADSGLIVVLAQSVAGLLFFTLGLHREVIRIFCRSLRDTSSRILHSVCRNRRWRNPNRVNRFFDRAAAGLSRNRVANDGGPRSGPGRQDQRASAVELAGVSREDYGNSGNTRCAYGSCREGLSGLRFPPAGGGTRTDRCVIGTSGVNGSRAWRIKKQRNRQKNGF